MKKTVVIIIVLFLSSCLKLDDNLFNPKNTIKQYELDNYTGEQDFKLSSFYDIPSNLITELTLESKTENETESTKIKAIYVGDVNTIATDTIILYCHGNKWHIDFYWQRTKLLAHVNGKNKYGVLILDYRGYGLSEGKASEQGMYADVDAAMKWLKLKGCQNQNLIMYGFSLGTAPTCELTSKPRTLEPSKIILEAPFASADVMANDGAQLSMPATFFTDLKIDNAEEIKNVNAPFLWIHGNNDNFLNYKTHGQIVFNNYKGTYKEFFIVDGADHGEVPAKMGFDKYLEVVGKFIRKP